MLSLLIPAFSLLFRPHILSVMLLPLRMLLYHSNTYALEFAISVNSLAPVIFRATSLDQ